MRRILFGAAVAVLGLAFAGTARADHCYRSGHWDYRPGHFDYHRGHFDYHPGQWTYPPRQPLP